MLGLRVIMVVSVAHGSRVVLRGVEIIPMIGVLGTSSCRNRLVGLIIVSLLMGVKVACSV
jgi:hypothetical protein